MKSKEGYEMALADEGRATYFCSAQASRSVFGASEYA